MSLHRATEHGAFPAEEVAALDRLAPHLVRAWMLRRHFTHATAVAAGALLALDHFVMPVFLVDANLRLSTMNVAADALLRADGPLKVRGGHLHVMPPANDDALCCSVRDALTGGLPPIMHLDKTGHSRVTLFVAADRRAQLGNGGLALIIANDHASTHQIVTDMLVRQFGLTVAEARTAAALTEGYAPLAIGTKFGISIETVRTQLRQAMLKCDTRGLVQLTNRVMASLAALRRP
jgi:DNA-binding CsgD family transcriptional regulator